MCVWTTSGTGWAGGRRQGYYEFPDQPWRVGAWHSGSRDPHHGGSCFGRGLLSLHPQGEDTARSCVIGGWRRKGGPGRVRTRQSRDGGGRPGCTGPVSAWAPEPPLGSPRLSWPRCCGGPRGAAGRQRKANEKQSFGPEKHTHSPLTSFQARKVKQGCD